jgi:hypothetical protein
LPCYHNQNGFDLSLTFLFVILLTGQQDPRGPHRDHSRSDREYDREYAPRRGGRDDGYHRGRDDGYGRDDYRREGNYGGNADRRGGHDYDQRGGVYEDRAGGYNRNPRPPQVYDDRAGGYNRNPPQVYDDRAAYNRYPPPPQVYDDRAAYNRNPPQVDDDRAAYNRNPPQVYEDRTGYNRNPPPPPVYEDANRDPRQYQDDRPYNGDGGVAHDLGTGQYLEQSQPQHGANVEAGLHPGLSLLANVAKL